MENKCPSCHSTNIRNDSIRNNNGIIGPGCRSWVVEEKYSCNDCGVYFKPVTERYLNLAIAGHGKPERAPAGLRWVKGTRNFPVKKPVIAKKFISYLNKEVVGTASSATGEMICFDWGVSSVCLAIGHEELNDLYWLDEQPSLTMQQEKKLREQAEQFFEDAIRQLDDPERKEEVEGERETYIGVWMRGYRAGEAAPAAGREEDVAEQDRKDGWELSAHYAHIEACEKKEAVAFVNWTLSSGCDTYTCTDEDQWTNIYTKENITTAELYDIFKKENP